MEDEALVGLAVEELLGEHGFDVDGPFTSASAAFGALAVETPQVAVVDYVLRDGSAETLLRALRERGVACLIYSGLPRGLFKLPADLADIPWLAKPTILADLVGAVRALAKNGP